MRRNRLVWGDASIQFKTSYRFREFRSEKWSACGIYDRLRWFLREKWAVFIDSVNLFSYDWSVLDETPMLAESGQA